MQDLIVAMIVLACTSYAVWALMPTTLRRLAAQQLLRCPWPQPVAQRLQRLATAGSGCGCDGCDAKQPPVQAIRIHRKPPG